MDGGVNPAEQRREQAAEKVRRYAHAAFRTAMLAATDPKIPVKFEAFHVTANPLATIRATPASADKRPMTVAELRAFWTIAKATEGTTGALMRLYLLTGGQIEAFEPKRLRSGIETALASLGIGREVRAQLQSHGLGGVQDRHYDDHDDTPEKRAALQALVDLPDAEPASNVTPIHGGCGMRRASRGSLRLMSDNSKMAIK